MVTGKQKIDSVVCHNTLTVRYPRREGLIAAIRRQGSRGVLFIETGRRLELAEQVHVLIEFPSDRRSFRLMGKVVSRRRASGIPPLSAGVEVEFPAEENRKLQLVFDFAQGKKIEFIERKSKRLPCSFQLTYRSDQGFVQEWIEDIGTGGTFIRTEKLMPIGAELVCRLKPPGYFLGIKIHCRVIWLKDWGFPKGMGVAFVFQNRRQQHRVSNLINRLTRQRTRMTLEKISKIRRRESL